MNILRSKRAPWIALAIAAGLTLQSCVVGPDYARPDLSAQLPESFDVPEGWKIAEPGDGAELTEWWRCFRDPELNLLMEKAMGRNQDLKAAFHRIEQSRAMAQAAWSHLLPGTRFEPSATRAKRSGTIRNTATNLTGITTTNLSLPFMLRYEIDFWGRIRRSIEAAESETLASEAACRQVALTLQAELTIQRARLRSLDAEIAIFEETVGLRNKSLDLIRKRFDAGDTDAVDVSRAETELSSTESELLGLRRNREEIENAIAVLAGEPSSGFRLAADPLPESEPPTPPVSLPAALLERRPDVAEAERLMAAANARIGVAKAAFFPTVSLNATAGLESGSTANLFHLASRTWGIGPEATMPIFEGGRNRAELRRAEAQYDEVTANYRQTVLDAIREVDDALAASSWLARQSEAQERTVASARRTVDLSMLRYEGGVADYFEVVDAQRTLLDAEQQAVRLRVGRRLAVVALVKALGGGWE
jgi:multidrug efflux system outer membrane protein